MTKLQENNLTLSIELTAINGQIEMKMDEWKAIRKEINSLWEERAVIRNKLGLK